MSAATTPTTEDLLIDRLTYAISALDKAKQLLREHNGEWGLVRAGHSPSADTLDLIERTTAFLDELARHRWTPPQ